MRRSISSLGGICAVQLIMAGSVAASPATSYPQTVPVVRKATSAEAVQIRRAVLYDNWTIGDDIKDQAQPTVIRVATTDLNGDGRPDLIVNLYGGGFCGSGGCSGYAILATASGFARSAIALPGFGGDLAGKVVVLPTAHGGMRDLRFDDNRYAFKWNGSEYR